MPHPPASRSLRPGRGGAPADPVAPSPRARLAELALDVALGLPDVVRAEAGPHGVRVTGDRSTGVLRGVSVTAEGEGRYAVDLRLVARIVPLVPLAEEIQRRVRLRAGREGLDAELGAVNIEFGRLVSSEDVVAEAAQAAEAAPPAAGPEPPPGGLEIPPPRAAPTTGLEPPPATGLAPPPTDPAPPPAVPPAPGPAAPPDRGGGP